ncbi:hypothetical protein Tco_0281813 [Tanacetum coccineum]
MEEDQARSNPVQSHVVLAGPNPEPIHEDFVAIVYPQVHENSRLTTEEHVHIENSPSSSRTLSSMKNLDDTLSFGDQFLNDKPTEEESGKANVETEVESMVTVPIHQASSSAPPLSTPIIDLTPPKHVSPPAQEPVFRATTLTTTTLLPPPPPQQQSTIVPELATRVSALEKICANFEKKYKLQDKTTQALSSRVFTLENNDLYSKIDNYINETIKEAVQNALQAPGRERFRGLSEFEMKEILRDQMFEVAPTDHSMNMQLSTTLLRYLWIMKIGKSSLKQRPSLVRDTVMTKILLHLLQKTQTKVRRKGTIMMHLLQNNLKLRRPQLGRLLTQEKLPLALPSKRLPLNLNSLLLMFDDVPILMMCKYLELKRTHRMLPIFQRLSQTNWLSL